MITITINQLFEKIGRLIIDNEAMRSELTKLEEQITKLMSSPSVAPSSPASDSVDLGSKNLKTKS